MNKECKMELQFKNFEELNVTKNRCTGYLKCGKRCRTRLKEGQYLFCCDDHKPYNREILEDGCFCCTEKIINHKDALFFRCKHLVHKCCYIDWMKRANNTYDEPICIICREVLYKKEMKEKKGEKEGQKKIDLHYFCNLFESMEEKNKIYDDDYKKSVQKFTFHKDSFIII